MNIFIVDDSTVFRKSLSTALRDIPGVVIVGEAGSVSDAVTCLQEARPVPEVLLLDIRMPGGSAMEVLRMVNLLNPRPTVIVLTNYSLPGYKKTYLQAGADYYFHKSDDQDALIETVTALSQTPGL